jgi:hypothetical protein
MRRHTSRCALGVILGTCIVTAAVLAPRAGALLRAPGCQVKRGTDGEVIFSAHSRDNIFQRLLLFAFPSHVRLQDLEVWTVAPDGKIDEWVWSIVCPADVPDVDRIRFGDTPAGCTQVLPSGGPPPPLHTETVYGVACSRGEATFVLRDGGVAVSRE